MLAAAAKQSRRLEPKVANFLLVPVPQTETVSLGNFRVLLFLLEFLLF